MTILITGAAGFIGYHVATNLLEQGEAVVGVDNLNDYYDVSIKNARLAKLNQFDQFHFEDLNIDDRPAVEKLISEQSGISYIVHLAAQAGVRYSLENPHSYVRSNVEGQLVLLEAARKMPDLKHFVFASSSSVYGANTKLPFAVGDPTDEPLSIYAATKKAGELMGYTYAHLYGLRMTGLRFFTVYGPWGRPDMAAFIFTRKILNGKPIPIFNNGNMRRNFTYIDDVVSGVVNCMRSEASAAKTPAFQLYNIGNSRSEKLMDFVSAIEKALGVKAEYDFQPMQAGDVKETVADITESIADFNFAPEMSIDIGIPNFVEWYRSYYE
jgi:UDP-glucuronate 4-epimerase